VIVDAYGRIVSVVFDDTYSYSEFKMDPVSEKLYVYVEGDKLAIPNSYRLVDKAALHAAYPTFADAITSEDLVEGINNAEINALVDVDVFETSRVINTGDATLQKWIIEADKLSAKIIDDQTTLGVQVARSATGVVTAPKVSATLTKVDVLLGLVQEILDGEAKLPAGTSLPAISAAVKGVYAAGPKLGGYDARVFDAEGREVRYNLAVVAVDAFGRIAGVYMDETDGTTASGSTTKWILGDAYNMNGNAGEWYEQALALSAAIVKNQGTAGFKLRAGTGTQVGNSYADDVAGASINVANLFKPVNAAIKSASTWALNDGTYFVEEDGLFMYVGIKSNAISFIYLDEVVAYAQATIEIRGIEYPLFTYSQQLAVGGEVKERSVLVYRDGTTYIYAESLLSSEGIPAVTRGERVSFLLNATDKVNEEATLEPVAGYGTKYMLDDAFKVQAEAWAKAVEGKSSPYILNLLPNGTTDTIANFTMPASLLQELLVEALLQAAAPAATAALSRLWVTPAADVIGSNDSKLADGRYFVSLPANAKGEQFFGLFVVDGGAVVNAAVDATRFVGGEVTTFVALGNAETISTTTSGFYKLIGAQLNTLVSSQFETGASTIAINGISDAFGYTDRDEIKEVPATSGFFPLLTRYREPLRLLYHELADVALRGRVEEVAAELGVGWGRVTLDGATIRKPLVSTATTTALGSSNFINLSTFIASGALPFNANAAATAKFNLRYDSSDRRIANIDVATARITPEVGLAADAVATVTVQLDFASFADSFSVPVTVKTAFSIARDAIAAANVAAPTTAPAFYAAYGFQAGKLVGLNNLITYSGASNIPLITNLGLINSGASVAAKNTIVSVDGNVQFFTLYGTDAPVAITNLNQLAPGNHVLTMVVKYDNAGTEAITDDLVTIQEYNITVLTQAKALADALAAARPSIILNNGEVTVDKVTLPVRAAATIASGISYNWSIVSGDNVATLNEVTGLLEFTRLYTQQKVVLEVSVSLANVSSQPAGQNSRQFEFRVMPFAPADIQERIEAELTAVALFERAPRFFDVSKDLGSNTLAYGVGSLVADLDDLISTTDLTTDGSNAVIKFSIASNVAGLQSSNIYSALNLVYIDPTSNELRLGRNAFSIQGEVDVTVTATVEVRFVSTNILPDVTYTDSFTFTIFNTETPVPTFTEFNSQRVFLFSGVAGSLTNPYAAIQANFGDKLLTSQRILLQGAIVEGISLIISGVSGNTAYATGAVSLGLASDNEQQVVRFNSALPGLHTGSGFDVLAEISYSYYEAGKLVRAVNPIEVVVQTARNFAQVSAPTAVSTAFDADTTHLLITLANARFITGLSNVAYNSGIVAANANNAAFGSGLKQGTFRFLTNDLGYADRILVTLSGAAASTQNVTLSPSIFERTNNATVSFTTTVIDVTESNTAEAQAVVVSGVNLITIDLTDAVFNAGAVLNSSSLLLQGSGTANETAFLNSGVLLSASFRRISDTRYVALIRNGEFTNSGLLQGSADSSNLGFILSSGTFTQIGATRPAITVTVSNLDLSTTVGYLGLLEAVASPSPALATETQFSIRLSGAGQFSEAVSISDFTFVGVNSGALPALDIALNASLDEVTFTGFVGLSGDLGGVYLNPSAISKGDSSAMAAYAIVGALSSTDEVEEAPDAESVKLTITLTGGVFAPDITLDDLTIDFGINTLELADITLVRISNTVVELRFTAADADDETIGVVIKASGLWVQPTSFTVIES
jgi:hypothetical protein